MTPDQTLAVLLGLLVVVVCAGAHTWYRGWRLHQKSFRRAHYAHVILDGSRMLNRTHGYLAYPQVYLCPIFKIGWEDGYACVQYMEGRAVVDPDRYDAELGGELYFFNDGEHTHHVLVGHQIDAKLFYRQLGCHKLSARIAL